MAPRAQLISAEELLTELGAGDLVLLDVRVRYEHERAVADRERYLEGHIPGAVFADVVERLSGRDDSGRQFLLPAPNDFAREAGALGIGAGKRVVVYSEGWPIWATRVWWLLRYHGFNDVALLDGGWQGWAAAGHDLESGEVAPAPQRFQPQVRPELLAPLEEVEAIVAGERNETLVNALPHEMFTGEVATHGTIHGRIPRSLSLPWTEAADLDSGHYRDPVAIADRSATLPADVPLVAYCGGGVSATGLIFGLSLIGRDDVKLYDGSMDEWASDPTRQLERDLSPSDKSTTSA